MYIYNKLNTLKLNSSPIYKNSMTSNYIPQCSPEILPNIACTNYAPIFPATQNPNEPNPYVILKSALCVEGYGQNAFQIKSMVLMFVQWKSRNK